MGECYMHGLRDGKALQLIPGDPQDEYMYRLDMKPHIERSVVGDPVLFSPVTSLWVAFMTTKLAMFAPNTSCYAAAPRGRR